MLAAALLSTLASTLIAASASAQPIPRQEELARVRERIAALQDQLARLERERQGLVGELVEVDLDRRLQEERLAEARLAHEEAQAAVAALEVDVRASAERVAAQRRALAGRLVHLYRMGRQGGLRLLLAAREERSFLEAFRLLRYLAALDSRRLAEYVAARSALERQAEALAAQRREAALWVERESERLAGLERLRSRQAALVAELERRSSAVREEADRLAARETQLARFLAALAGTADLAGEPMQGFAGVLERPVLGAVVRPFGPRLDPRYGTRIPHHGVEFATLPAAEVRAVYPGRVLFADRFEGYGLTVIVLHPGRVFSLYAGLRELRVAPEDVLSLNGLLGTSSGHVYFEIRVENKPVDPASWLR